jgi:hypothetical protein
MRANRWEGPSDGEDISTKGAGVKNRGRRRNMQHVHEGQCGLCTHYGESHQRDEKLIKIRVSKEAPEILVDDCGHPRHASLHLRVTPISGCDGFEPALVS